jgi:hypothetical protein
MNESVGPWKPEGNRLWFGKTFYDGEGYQRGSVASAILMRLTGSITSSHHPKS